MMQHQHQHQQVYPQHSAPPPTAPNNTTNPPPSAIPPPPGATFLNPTNSSTPSTTSSGPNTNAASPMIRQPPASIYSQGPPPYGYAQYTTSPSQQSHAPPPSSGSSQTGPPSTGYGTSSTSSSPEWGGYAQHQQPPQWATDGYTHSSSSHTSPRNTHMAAIQHANAGDRIQLAPLRHHSSSAMSVTSSTAASPIMPHAHNGSSPDAHPASVSVIQLRSPGRDNAKMLPPPPDFGRDRDQRGSLTDQRGAGKKNLLSIGSIISNSNDR
ncbi:hypothetical protein P691DRAFT_808717 [Macrolepiota fuliginosa MF-IS2]|uniref:Uncharacterized protein n=1 Tax=Macrolepiota fuliginosa MF-IS2 TaxID=1400762 RepID=A0A9P5X588_9AGAR|nr:hypothetical protein P691DRAFT_808717 [Macrolepiota fuliginosa MF-IS2]